MIFDGRPLSDIKNEEVAALVKAHVCERQHLEFKITINLRTDDEKLSFCGTSLLLPTAVGAI